MTTVAALSEAAGLSTRQFYEEFRTLEDVLAALHLQVNDWAEEAALGALAGAEGLPLAERDAAIFRAYAANVTVDPRRIRMTFVEIIGVSARLEEQRLARRSHWVNLICTEAEAAVARGEAAPRDYQLAATAFIGSVNGLLHDWSAGWVDATLDEAVDELVRMLLGILRPAGWMPRLPRVQRARGDPDALGVSRAGGRRGGRVRAVEAAQAGSRFADPVTGLRRPPRRSAPRGRWGFLTFLGVSRAAGWPCADGAQADSRSSDSSTGPTPSSAPILAARARARSPWEGSRVARSRAEASEAVVSLRSGTARGATPRETSRAAQKPSSNWIGTGTAGTPARRPAAVVPAPQWWTTAVIRGNSAECATSPIVSMSSPSAASPPHPRWITPRIPVCRRALITAALSRPGSGTVALPRPTKTGGGPEARNASSSGGRCGWVSYGHQ